ncbi:prephenate dehydrogenase [Xanthomonas fragariae]|uniref:Prephenate dehydrogenase n=1 Tax=Xanthomonas fragariae TaxID=48664 RepID=A0A1Y6HHH9_9XANT|nr:prephenate dehydrogenase [Xanthomonas fragariae]AOD14681.1 prephenate dehydrogenase [Xanthomonas fragariae]AOD18075.1 prephenate dehydrogenase [Xanthomonas fragariae]ENZ96287.1 prephenate dehydrogenase [Xanthomonas fragariae LMG 25863]MBL9195911.1 prephenate dehydrogenase [Xanthomonas fragariae]MBL9220579.1 prephenate dehydrogenase [Xanthomonas fragariae]
MMAQPVVGIVGIAGAYGRWLAQFLRTHMQLEVIGFDPTDGGGMDEATLAQRADVLIFSAPIRHTATLIERYVELAGPRAASQLWMDVTSIKQAPVAAMLASQAEVVGLHPMTAPPKSPTLKGRMMVVCEARLRHWSEWVQTLCAALQAECVYATPEHHDRVMALVQAMVHATHLVQAGTLRDYAPLLGELRALMPYRSASFELDNAVIARILSLNPSIYEDIQFGNPYVGEMLDQMLLQLQQLRALVAQGDDAARAQFRSQFLDDNAQALQRESLTAGNYTYERVGYLLADLTEPLALSVYLPEDQPGSLRALLHVFEQHGVNLSSIHSSRTPAGELHFRIGFESKSNRAAVAKAANEIDRSGIGRVLERSGQVD